MGREWLKLEKRVTALEERLLEEQPEAMLGGFAKAAKGCVVSVGFDGQDEIDMEQLQQRFAQRTENLTVQKFGLPPGYEASSYSGAPSSATSFNDAKASSSPQEETPPVSKPKKFRPGKNLMNFLHLRERSEDRPPPPGGSSAFKAS